MSPVTDTPLRPGDTVRLLAQSAAERRDLGPHSVSLGTGNTVELTPTDKEPNVTLVMHRG